MNFLHRKVIYASVTVLYQTNKIIINQLVLIKEFSDTKVLPGFDSSFGRLWSDTYLVPTCNVFINFSKIFSLILLKFLNYFNPNLLDNFSFILLRIDYWNFLRSKIHRLLILLLFRCFVFILANYENFYSKIVSLFTIIFLFFTLFISSLATFENFSPFTILEITLFLIFLRIFF